MHDNYFAAAAGSIHYVEEGEGPTVILLHGFPEFWYAWREQIPALAAAGFRVIAPDLRGYNLSHKPRALDDYRAIVIADEIGEFIRGVAPDEKIALVGHDWGAIVAWHFATRHRDLLSRLVILSVPHLATLRRMTRSQVLQKFWYQFAVQPPMLPEMALRARRFALLAKVLTALSKRRDALTEEVLDRYREAWNQPGALTAMLHYYRAFLRRHREFPRGDAARIEVPTLMIAGGRDHLFRPDFFEYSLELLADAKIQVIRGGGHFVQHDCPEETNAAIAGFLKGQK